MICVAEGAGQDLLGGADSGATDASGNPILKDIGLFLKDALKTKLKVRIDAMHQCPVVDRSMVVPCPYVHWFAPLRADDVMTVMVVMLRSPAHTHHFRTQADVKYIDPSYMVRAMPTNAADRIYCKVLGQNAVHANFAGYTGVTVGQVNTHHVMLPIPVIIQAARTVDPKGRDYDRLLAAIQQPDLS